MPQGTVALPLVSVQSRRSQCKAVIPMERYIHSH